MLVNQKFVSGNKNPLEMLIVDINERDYQVMVCDLLLAVPKRPVAVSLDVVKQKLASKEWVLQDHTFPEAYFLEDEDIGEKWLTRRNTAYKTIKPLIEDPELLYRYFYGDPAGILQSLMDQSGKGKKYVQGAVNRYFYSGGFKNSLLPKYYNSGANHNLPDAPVYLTNQTVCLKSKPGRRTKYGEPYRHLTKLDRTKIKAFAERFHQSTTVNLTDLYREFSRDHYMAVIKPDDAPEDDIFEEFLMLLPRRFRISPRAFKRCLKQYVGTLAFIRKRVGSINYERDHAGKPGLARQGLRGPTSRYEIDSTTADIYIRYEYTNDKLLSIGRPVIYLVIDVVSGMIVGVHVSFHGPDWHAESQALFNAFTDKVAFCKKFGVDIEEKDWPCHHTCRELTFDRGTENGHKNTRSLLKGKIGVTAANFNAYHRGDAKGTVEQKFHTVQTKAIPRGAGNVVKVPRKEDQHPSRKPVFTYAEFMKRLIKVILHTNNNNERVISHNFEMSRDGVGFTPRDVWNWGLQESMIPPVEHNVDTLRFALLPQANATVRDKGVYLKGLYYSSNEVIELQWLDKAKNDGRFTQEVRYCDVNTSYIWCKHPETDKVFRLELTQRSEAYKNQLWEQVLQRMEIVKDELARLDERRFSSRVLLDMDLSECEKQIRQGNKHLEVSTAKTIQPDMKETAKRQGEAQKQADFMQIHEDLERTSDFTNKTTFKPKRASQSLPDPTAVPYPQQEVSNG